MSFNYEWNFSIVKDFWSGCRRMRSERASLKSAKWESHILPEEPLIWAMFLRFKECSLINEGGDWPWAASWSLFYMQTSLSAIGHLNLIRFWGLSSNNAKQCCDNAKLDCTHAIFSDQTMLSHHKAWLYSFYFFPPNTPVTLQSFIVLMPFLPVPQCRDTTNQAVLQFMT